MLNEFKPLWVNRVPYGYVLLYPEWLAFFTDSTQPVGTVPEKFFFSKEMIKPVLQTWKYGGRFQGVGSIARATFQKLSTTERDRIKAFVANPNSLFIPLSTITAVQQTRARIPSGADFLDPLTEGRRIIESDPVLSSVQDTMSKASAIYQDAMGTDHVLSGVESTQQFISGVMNASPEQLDRMSLQLEGMNAEADIRQSVAEHEAELRESNANHQAIMDANAADLEAQKRIAEAEALIANGVSLK